jgi:hypothetical protein
MIRRIIVPLALLFVCGATRNNTYTTNFPATETPISQGGKWLNGYTNGLDWGDVYTRGGTAGYAYGTTISPSPPFNDSIAILNIGRWTQDQTVCGTVYISKSLTRSGFYPEVELATNFSLSAHNAAGYIFSYSVLNPAAYATIGIWYGPLNHYKLLVQNSRPPTLNDGDTICGTNVGGTLTFSHNGRQVAQVIDRTHTGGSPGIGMYNQNGTNRENSLYGLSSFRAWGSLI